MQPTKNTRQFNDCEMALFFVLNEHDNVELLFEELKTLPSGWVLMAIEKRFKAHNVQADQKVMIAILTIGDGVVGKCAKYVEHIIKLSKNKTQIDWEFFASALLPFEIPVF